MCQELQPNYVNAVIRLESVGVKWYCGTCRVKIVVNLPKTTEAKNPTTRIKLNNIKEIMKVTQSYAAAAKANTQRI